GRPGAVPTPRPGGRADRRARAVSPGGARMSRRAEAGQAAGEEGARTPAELTRLIAEIVDDKKGEEIVALDVGELVSYTDYLVIATARNERQAKAIVDEVRLRLKREEGRLPARVEGESEARWVLLDYLDCVL